MEKSAFASWNDNNASADRVDADLYPTPGEATRALIRRVQFKGPIWECAAGMGHISWEFHQAGHEYISTDLFADKYGHGAVLDFLQTKATLAPNIVTNPPYKLLGEFMRHALLLPGIDKVALFVPYPAIAYIGVRKTFEELGYPELILSLLPQFEIYMGEERGWQQSFFKHCWLVWDRSKPKRSESRFIIDDWRKPNTELLCT